MIYKQDGQLTILFFNISGYSVPDRLMGNIGNRASAFGNEYTKGAAREALCMQALGDYSSGRFATNSIGGAGGTSDGDPGDGNGGGNANPSYKVITYQEFVDRSRDENGWALELVVYLNSAYDKTEWIQSVNTSTPGKGQPYKKWFNDYLIGDPEANLPFYYTKDAEKVRKFNNSRYGGIYFDDSPGRWTGETKNYYFQANLNLVGLRNGVWENIISFSWGFMQLNGMLFPQPVRVTTPNSFSWDLINNLNKK